MEVRTDFYGGTIDCLDCVPGGDATFRLRPDPRLHFAQGFYFRISGDGQPTRLVIENAGDSLIPMGWENYEAFTSKDDAHWHQTGTEYVDGKLIIHHQTSEAPTYYSYFPPYKPSHHDALMDTCRSDDRVTVRDLCPTSPDDRIELISIGSQASDAINVWAIGRQHPGEIQASWWMEGFVRKLLDPADDQALVLLARTRVHIVPNMNPDGSRLGLYRTNIQGRNLNASWDCATVEDTPAVYAVLEEMTKVGMDFCMDVHADEELPYVFIAMVDRIIPVPDGIAGLHDSYQFQLAALDSAFRPKAGYVRPHTKSNPLSFCSPYLMKRFGAPSVTFELPFKRFDAGAEGARNYGVEGCIHTGRAALSALVRCLDGLSEWKAVRQGQLQRPNTV